MPDAVIYIRFSTKRQEKGFSKERQLEECEAFCRRKGWNVVEVVEDLGQSAWKGHHLSVGNLGKWRKRVDAGDVAPSTTLVIHKLDRLSRLEPRVTQRWMEDLCDKGIRIATVDGERIFDEAYLKGPTALMGIMEIVMNATVSHKESEKKSELVADAWRRKQQLTRQGKVLSAKPPAWLRVVGERIDKDQDYRRYELIPERVAVLKQIYEWAADGIGYWGIAKRLNEKGVPSWGKARSTTTNKGWGWSYVGILLKHPAIDGEYHPAGMTESGKRKKTGERIENVFPRAVDADLVARARASASKRWQTRSGRYAAYARNLFSTLARCRHCGGLMTMRGRAEVDARYRYLQCDSAARHTGCDRREFFNHRIFEKAALDAMLHLALDGRFFQRDDLSGPLAIRLAEIERAIENKKAEAKRLVRKMAQFDDEDRDEFDDVLRAVKQEQRALEGECAKVAEELQAARGHLPPNVHLQRVLEVREAINDPSDPEAMRDARLKVREAIRNVVDVVWCDPVEMIGGVPTRTLTLLMAGNAAGIKFDNQGNTIGTFNFLPELAAGGASYTLRDGTTVSTNANALRDALLNRPVRLSASEEEADAAASEKRDAAARLDTVLKRGRSRRTA